MTKILRADSATWKHIPSVELWQAVALSLDIEPLPVGLLQELLRAPLRAVGASPPVREFQRRLRIAQANVAMSGPLVPEQLFPDVFDSPHAVVSLSQFANWARPLPPFDPLPEWLLSIGEVGANSAPTPLWPWGDHTTELLGHLAEAGRKFWTNYAPDDPSSAPTNVAVTEWLTGRGVSQRTAEAMATLLRADGLPSGPRR